MKIRYLWLALITLFALASLLPSVWAGEEQSPAGAVAIVNGEIITQVAFDRTLQRSQQRFPGSGQNLNAVQLIEMKKKVLDNMINFELVYQTSNKEEIVVEESAVNIQFNEVKKRFGGEDKFEESLQHWGLSEEGVKDQIRREMAVNLLIDKNVISKIDIPDEEIREFYEKYPDFSREPESVRASHILIKVAPDADKAKKTEAKKKIKAIQKKIKKGENFAKLAEKFSEGPSSTRGGDLDYFRRGQMVKPFDEVAFSLKPGEVSNIVETRFGYHLIKLVDKKSEGRLAFEKVKPRLENNLKQIKVRENVGVYIDGLREKAKVEIFLEGDAQ